MPTLKHHITDPITATKGIADILGDLSHKGFMVELETPPAFDTNEIKFAEGQFRCIECGAVKGRPDFQKLFQRGEGICKKCWNHDDTWTVKDEEE
jgi:hypothetical protein